MNSNGIYFKFDDAMFAAHFPVSLFMGSHKTEPPVTSSINCNYRVWQNIVLTGLSLSKLVTNEIPITFIWSYLCRQLSIHGIAYTQGDYEIDVDWIQNRESQTLPLRSSVTAYLLFLTKQGYLVDLRERIGHDDEYVFKLSCEFEAELSRLQR